MTNAPFLLYLLAFIFYLEIKMKSLVAWLVLFTFSFISMTPCGFSISTLRADDFELEELDLGLEEDEESEDEEEEEEEEEEKPAPKKKSAKKNYDEDEEDEEESEESGKEESDKLDSEDSEEESGSSIETIGEKSAGAGNKLIAVQLYDSSSTELKASKIASSTVATLAESKDYDFVNTEADLFSDRDALEKALESAKSSLERGKTFYNDLNTDDATIRFKNALRSLEGNLDKLTDYTLLSEVILYTAACYKMAEEDSKADPFMRAYISINPDASIDDSFAPEVVDYFNEIKDDYAAKSNASIKFSGAPNGADVFLDGKFVGQTPLTLIKQSIGNHYYRIHKNGFKDAGGVITLTERKMKIVDQRLSKIGAASSFLSETNGMKSEMGTISMLRKTTDIAEKLGVDYVLVTYATLDGKNVKYTGYMVNKEKRSFKKAEATLPLTATAATPELKSFNDNLTGDSYEYKAIADLAMEEAGALGLIEEQPAQQDKDKSKEKKPVYKEWWLWTIVGVAVAAGVGVGIYFGVAGNGGGSSGPSLDINFGK